MLTQRSLMGALVIALLGVAMVVVIRQRRPDPGGQAVLRTMEAILDEQGLTVALDSLAARARRDTALERDGHQMAHALGRKAATRNGGNAAAVADCRPLFASGCYHGVIEASLQAGGRIDMAELERLCLSAGRSDGPAPTFECAHGLGHGLLGARGHDVAATLKDCDAISSARLAASCHAGVFMEAINAAVGAPATHGTHHHAGGHEPPGGLAVDPSDPYSPCRAFAEPQADACWLFQGFLILRANDFDPGRALGVCDDAPGGRAARCYESVGHQITGLFQKGDRWVLDQCARGRAELAAHCAAGATLALNAMDWTGSRSAGLCARAPAEWKETCYRTASYALVDLAPPPQRARLCASVEPGYVETCREAGGLARHAQG